MSAVVSIVCPKEKATFNNISVSRNTVTRRVKVLGDDLKTTLRERVSIFKFYSLAMDESTDVKNFFIRGIDCNFQITEEMAALVPMEGTTTAKDLMEAVVTCMKDLGLSSANMSGTTSDGAPSMVGKNTGVVALLRKEKQLHGYGDIISAHYIIHQENLSAKTLSIPDVMAFVVKTINFIKARGLNHRQFQQMLTEMEAEYGDLLYYCEIRWLSRGAMLERFYSLRKEIALFLQDKGKSTAKIYDPKWICGLAFLVDISKHLNDLNTKLQGKDQHVGILFSHIKAFETKL
ncbi:general transcription factor II-I repeat domain-containing protein 2-like [Uranotaenia lowii]|uniref:general transcription factor II-I repeat domain-containing protein 2-like n=1 Tax=Uranotaenia lowii TaxID=190385 RepID=UPI002479469E|nr:general transcription factor II-I repeat domain-containing protein 2-like [Uranotaenia lowii]